jgi:hypothetical protein
MAILAGRANADLAETNPVQPNLAKKEQAINRFVASAATSTVTSTASGARR